MLITMLSSLRYISFKAIARCPRHDLSQLYSTSIDASSRAKWRLSGIPSPRSILEDDDAVIDLSEDNEAVNGVRPNTPPPHLRTPPDKPTPHEWKEHRKVMRKDFPEGWMPPHKLSREAMEGLRQLHQFDSEKFNTPMLAEKFRISPEAVRRILKSKWEPSRDKRMKLAEKEREQRAEFIKLNRLKERIEARRLADLNKGTKRRGVGPSRLYTAHGSTGDRFTFE